MVPFIVLVVAFGVFFIAGRLGARFFASWVVCLRWALFLMFLLTASAHFGSQRADLVRMVPSAFPTPELLVTLTGIAEVAGAVGLVIPRLAPFAAVALAVLLVAIFPANVHAAREAMAIGGRPVTPLVPRILLQIVFIAAVLLAGFGRRHRR